MPHDNINEQLRQDILQNKLEEARELLNNKDNNGLNLDYTHDGVTFSQLVKDEIRTQENLKRNAEVTV